MDKKNEQKESALPNLDKKENSKNLTKTLTQSEIKTEQQKTKDRNYKEPEVIIDEFLLKDKSIEQQKNNMRKLLGMEQPIKQKKQINFYRNLKIKLYKAGFETEPELFVRKINYISIGILIITILILGSWMLIEEFKWLTILITIVIFWVLGFIIIYYLSLLISFVYLSYRAFKRTKEVEKVLPEYLRLVANNYRSGLALDKALMASNRPRFGILSKEIEQVAKTTRIKGDFAKALEIFGKKFDSKILERSMNSISMSVRSGSNISEILDEIANNITKMRNMQASMAANVKNYVIFIIVAGIIIAPLMFAMSYQMNQTISAVKGKLDVQTDAINTGSPITLGEGGGVSLRNFDVFAILMILTNCVVSTMIISMIKYGNFHQGLNKIFIYIIISVSLYFIGKYVLSGIISVV